MVQLLEKHFLQRANAALLLTFVWGGLAVCAIGAGIYDISHWVQWLALAAADVFSLPSV